MPSYGNRQKTYSKSLGKWVDKKVDKAFDYNTLDMKSAALLVSFFRWYPDYFLDCIRSENAQYGLELPQRLILRVTARYKDTYDTASRGMTKSYLFLLGKMVKGVLYPGITVRTQGPAQKQAASIISQAYHQIERDYPLLASWWNVKHDTDGMFIIKTNYGSEIGMYVTRGGNSTEVGAEEIGQEGNEKERFDMEKFERDVLPTCRSVRFVNQKKDRTHINQQHSFMSNACSRTNPAYYKHRYETLKSMIYGEKYAAYVLDFSWITALLCNIRDITYMEDMRKMLSANDWLREMCAIYVGTNENPIVTDETLARSRRLMCMEDSHCGDNNAIYIVSHDVSYEDGAKNAKCGDVVLKLTRFKREDKRDKYRKQVVYVDGYPPPKTDYAQARKIKDMWFKYCKNGAETTYLVIDTQAYGKAVVEELMKPSNDGLPPLCCYKHLRYKEIEQPHALEVIYPLKAGTRGAMDEDGEMIRYAQVEFEQGNLELLTGATLDGIEQYKRRYGIKDNNYDSQIAKPYTKTDELCQQIQNLKIKASGVTVKEERKSKSIQRDLWSALKYALRMAQILEQELAKQNYRAKSSWHDTIAQFAESGQTTIGASAPQQYIPIGVRAQNPVDRLLQERRR